MFAPAVVTTILMDTGTVQEPVSAGTAVEVLPPPALSVPAAPLPAPSCE